MYGVFNDEIEDVFQEYCLKYLEGKSQKQKISFFVQDYLRAHYRYEKNGSVRVPQSRIRNFYLTYLDKFTEDSLYSFNENYRYKQDIDLAIDSKNILHLISKPKECYIFFKYVFCDWTFKEIGEELGTTESNIHHKYFHACEELRLRLKTKKFRETVDIL